MDKKLIMPGAIVLAGIIIAGAIIATSDPTPKRLKVADNSNTVTEAVQGSSSGPGIEGNAILGDPNAPVTWIEFGDYECPFCKQLFETEKRIKEEYVATGKMKMVYRDFPLDFHPNAVPAAEAAECAGDQGSYWAYHDILFERQSQLGTLNYVAVAGELGLDTEIFASCVENRTHKDEVEKDMRDGVAAGVQGTPGVFINGEMVAGAYPYEHFVEIIERKLAE